MGLFRKLIPWRRGASASGKSVQADSTAWRHCSFEEMEARRVLSADPVVAGITYLEGDTGQDNGPDHFEVTFVGGSETTQLTQFTINGDQDLSGGLSDGDMFFDIDGASPGTGGYAEFQFDAANSSGVTAADIRSIRVSADGLLLTVEVDNFEAGDVFAFTIDVDEVERFKQDKIASGVEFESTLFNATFQDEHYQFVDRSIKIDATLEEGFVQPQSEGFFYDEYDQLFQRGGTIAGDPLELDADNQTGQQNRSAGAIDAYDLKPKPITISGNVFHDEDLNCLQHGSESGIAGVTIQLQQLNDYGVYETVASTRTDAQGHYEFGRELGLLPGQYRLIEIQPTGFLDVGASVGKVEGTETGAARSDASGNVNIISDIDIPLGNTAATNYDFCEVRPASLSGTVWHDRNDDGEIDPGEEGIANVLIRVTRIGAPDGVADDPFASMDPVFVRTDANGNYEVDQLPPGVYSVIEINNDPPGGNPLSDYLDGKASIGQVAGKNVGTVTNDRFNQIELRADDEGVEYNFGELKTSTISGYVSLATPDGECVDPDSADHQGIGGVTIELYDADGEKIASTKTNANGFYRFDELRPGTYTVIEVQPDAYLDAGDELGKVNGQLNGRALANDGFADIRLTSDQAGVMYNFCEQLPATLAGTVYHDRNDDGSQDAGEEGIANVLIRLYDADGNQVAQTRTDANGDYEFTGLVPGVYSIREFQPDSYVDGQDSLGMVDGSNVGRQANDRFSRIQLLGGQAGTEYNFGELRYGSISGFVIVDANGDCVLDRTAGERPLAGVTMELLNSDGEVIATTETSNEGFYRFNNLKPGEYSVRQQQPEDVFTEGQSVGIDIATRTGGTGEAAGENLIRGITIGSGQQLVQYNFCEVEPARIGGRVWEDGPAFQTEDGVLPANYRSQRDGVYQAGVDRPLAGVRMQLYYYIDPDASLLEPRPVTLAEVLPGHYPHLRGASPDSPVWVETDAQGQYEFTGLKPGSYIVLEAQPTGYADGNDIVGTTTGFTYNSELEAQVAPQAVTRVFSSTQVMDAVVNIQVARGGISAENNFTEVRVEALPDTPEQPRNPYYPPPRPEVPGNPITPNPGITGLPGLAGSRPSAFTTFVGTSRTAAFQVQPASQMYTWHLSVINAGQPRSVAENLIASDQVWHQVSALLDSDWHRFDLNQVGWSFTTTDATGEWSRTEESARFGMMDGIPLAGDFDGDGVDELAVYRNGYWFIDINRNGQWEETDLLARLGDHEDLPVVGDWDGDGKDDIGIYGPMWPRDPAALRAEPGLPNPDNLVRSTPKNVPPTEAEATDGVRIMRLTSHGKQRADLVDHVFDLGEERDIPVTGDWNGNGIRSVGVFSHGLWKLDVNGDGQFDSHDEIATFGRTGDIPLVGDFDGDGVDDIAIYRAGTWIIDTDGNRELDATDRTFEMGGAEDTPVVGDWDGDGIDEPALYHARRRAAGF